MPIATQLDVRRSTTLLATLAFATGAALLTGGGASACGCGVVFRAEALTEQALITYARGRETIIPGLALTRVGAHAAVVLPMPVHTRIGLVSTKGDLFAQLAAATTRAPRLKAPPGVGGPSPVGSAPRPKVLAHRVIGGYEVLVLRGNGANALGPWLRAHGYAVPAAAARLLADYVHEGWRFVAIRFNARRSGEIKPLALSFPTARIVYPMRLDAAATEPVSVRLFVNAAAVSTSSGVPGLASVFAGRLSELTAPLPADVRALLPAPYLTRFEADALSPASVKADATFSLSSPIS
jgi:hypothetical protein